LSNQKAGSTKNLPRKAQNTLQGSCNYVDLTFLQCFVGFFEGDGCLMKTNHGDLMFVITQSISDKQVLEIIKEKLGFGEVYKQGPTTHRFVVQNIHDLYKICNILNGNLILPVRKEVFRKFVRAYNKKAISNNLLTIEL
jgi:retron-type reverse transcriptase